MANLSNDQIKAQFAAARKARAEGRLSDAERGFLKLQSARPDLAEVHFNLGEVFALRGKLANAAQAFEKALNLRPSEPVIWQSYMDIALDHPDLAGVEKMVARAKSALGATALATYFEARLAKRQGKPSVAFFKAAKSEGIAPERLFAELADAIAAEGDVPQALSCYEDGLKAFPKSVRLIAQMADLLRDTGEFERAVAAARQAIKLQPENGQLYHAYASIQKLQADDPLIADMQKLLEQKSSKHPDRRYLAFALAKAMEDTEETPKVFKYLSVGNRDFDKDFPYGYEADKTDLAEIRELAARLEEKFPDAQGHASSKPIFVTGMPRSGTTLIEQIIAAHSSVTAGGELGELGPELSKFRKHAGAIGSDAAMSNVLEGHGKAYISALNKVSGGAHVTDKSISTFANIGLVRRMLPDAKIVVVLRDPRDNAFSIYKNLFRPGLHRYSTNLRNIARFTRLFEAQMAYWTETCPEAFTTIQYEDLIADPEAQSRALIEAIGLPWEDQCLSFHENRTRVKTLSSVQIRQPIYASSTMAWQKYEADLKPFIEEYDRLGD